MLGNAIALGFTQAGASEAPELISGLVAWFDPTDTANMVLESADDWNGPGNYVTSWTDRIAGITVSQATLANKPFLNAGGYLEFNGSQWLRATSGISGLLGTTQFTKVFRFYQNNPSGNYIANELNPGDASSNRMYAYWLTSYFMAYAGTGNLRRQTGNLALEDWHTVGHLYHDTEASQKLFRNGVEDATVVTTNGGIAALDNATYLYIGAGRVGTTSPYVGRLQDLLFYNAAVSEADHLILHNYFEAR